MAIVLIVVIGWFLFGYTLGMLLLQLTTLPITPYQMGLGFLVASLLFGKLSNSQGYH